MQEFTQRFQTQKGSNERLFIFTRTNFRGNPLYQATKRHLNNRKTVLKKPDELHANLNR